MNPIAEDILMHYGVKYRSGRYPYGSGENPYQHSGDFVSRVKQLKKDGLSEKDIAKAMGYESTTDYRYAYSIAKNESRRKIVDEAKALAEDGKGASEIGRILAERHGMDKPITESTIRSYLNKDSEANMNAAQKTSDVLKKELESKKFLDVGTSVERELGVSKQKLNEAVRMLEYDGYMVVGVGVPQVNNTKRQTNTKVLVKKGEFETVKEAQSYLYKHMDEIKSVTDYRSTDGGQRWDKREYPSSIKSDRVQICYGDQGGAEKDGVLEIRRGVPDLDLGKSHYAQVRIMVDGTHYLKGMAIYSDDLPDGVDIRFNTNKKTGTPKHDVMKKIKDDPDNPFGALIKADGQYWYNDPKTGERKLGAINKLKEEGDWDKSSRNLSSQFLSKQPIETIKKQLRLTYSDYESEFDEIKSLTIPAVRKKQLLEFADSCEAAAVHLKAAAFPRQETRVILPVTKLKETEVYAPYLKNGEKVCLVRFPHGGTFEIPELTVNNRNQSARKILGDATDAIGINSKVAERLSGADFDGDTVVVIPVNSRVRVKTSKPLKDLEGFDPKDTYGSTKKIEDGKEVYYNAQGKKFKIMDESEKQKQMGMVSNLITDMTLRGAPESDLAKAVKHSMVVIDAPKHKLDYKQSERDNDIATLKKRWQPKYDEQGNPTGEGGGASTLISRRKQTTRVPERQGAGRIDEETGQKVYRESGRTYTNKQGKTVAATTEVFSILNTPDVNTMSSGTRQEAAYADFANKMKTLSGRARKEYLSTKKMEKSPTAAKLYAAEVKSLDDKLDRASRNEPKERTAQRLANSTVKAKIQSNPDLAARENKKELNKVKQLALADARASVGASSKNSRIEITDSEWKAIQSGALSENKLTQILRYTDPDAIKERALPKTTTTISAPKLSKAKAMKASGLYTIAEIADAIGVSPSTVSKYLNN